jgi:uncharacterized SAM-binding protein YcdF (DUF218 family)
MFFIISKILGFMLDPFNLLTLLLLLGTAVLFKKSVKGKKIIYLGAALLLICGLDYVPRYSISILENRISSAKIPDEIDGIIVLAGMVDMKSSREGLVELTSSADRIINGVILANIYTKAKLIIAGGSGSLIQEEGLKEADYLKRLSIALGIKEQRIVVERESRNTYEHTEKLARLISKDGNWVLVTSASHMPRAFGCFRKAGFHVLPYPVDYQNRLNKYAWSNKSIFWPATNNFEKLNSALHEWVGLISYRLSGYTDSFFPKVITVPERIEFVE